MDAVSWFIDFFLHLDKHLAEIIAQYGTLTYSILFLIIFAETGLVVTPILPGDSLLFAAGALAGTTGILSPHLLVLLLSIAGIAGDTVNYHIGKYLGPKVFNEQTRWLKREYLQRTHEFYERHGGKTIIIARFIPIIRTFAPFVAGIGAMTYTRFIVYNFIGAVLWVSIFVYAGFAFGNHPIVRKNFTLVIIGIIFVSILPGVIEFVRAKLAARKLATGGDQDTRS